MDTLLVVDMQQGLLEGDAKHRLPEVVERINLLATRTRGRGGAVIFIQHAGPPGDPPQRHCHSRRSRAVSSQRRPTTVTSPRSAGVNPSQISIVVVFPASPRPNVAHRVAWMDWSHSKP
jgi:nicotinamidase-related amidase